MPTRLTRGDLRIAKNGWFWFAAMEPPFFYVADTAWEIFHRLTLKKRSITFEAAWQKTLNPLSAQPRTAAGN